MPGKGVSPQEVVMAEDEWLHTFRIKAAPRLRALLETDLDGLPQQIQERLERLRKSEAERAHAAGDKD
jgi:hypothetical protein